MRRASNVLLQHHCQAKEWINAVRVILSILCNRSEPTVMLRSQKWMEEGDLAICSMRSGGLLERTASLKHCYSPEPSAASEIQTKSALRTWHSLQSNLLISFGVRKMSTGGISRKDYLWGISGSRQALPGPEARQEAAAEERKAQEPDFFAQLEKEGYGNIQEALQRVIIGAYQLLQEDRVDQAESMVDEGVSLIFVTPSESQNVRPSPSIMTIRTLCCFPVTQSMTPISPFRDICLQGDNYHCPQRSLSQTYLPQVAPR